MRAAVRHRYGPPEVLEICAIDRPECGPDQVLVRVHATTVNRTDCAVLMAKPFIMRPMTGWIHPKRATTGTDFAGEVVAVGAEVDEFEIGDRVWGFHDEGLSSHAEYLVAGRRENVAKMPAGVSFVDAAASLEAAHYAANFVKRLQVHQGDRVLVNGASGAIGSAVVQLLKNKGVIVTAVCGTANIPRVETLNPDEIIDYEREDFRQTSTRFHAVLDAVGKSSFGRCRHLLLPRGVYISSELGWGCQNPLLALVTPCLRGKVVRFPLPTNIAASMQQMGALLTEGKFAPLIDRQYPLEEIRDAFGYVLTGEKCGNVMLTFDVGVESLAD
ncbi:NAD(P)-dependent alcohol dehydrogenase [Rosistilla oblonga]|uniref:NAD(P)-dependent alcohol dehydrogenase n=1 Tax=Rosistilla oblonga TaxID=2527990 RepID=UPI0011A95E6D|nr:NAD(P)-dependent alcohol dehydrogenase [Rosistilla oblonga]